ncbi:MAG TPA: flavin reductase family protein [Thermodesulfovibrionales bacterium]|nr:flavin reductase family protein [Thermodesulfovibrionales bacterium]
MEKIPLEKRLFCLPWTQTILGTHLKGKVNFMALDWLTRVNFEPAMIGICLNRQNASHAAVEDTGEFSVNVPNVAMVEVTDYTGIVSGRTVDKSGLFEVFYGELPSAPMIKTCPITMECRLVETVSLPTNSFFIGEIVTLYSEERFLTDGKPDVKKMNPFVLTMPDNRYWSIGEPVGKAWNAGIALRERLKQP